MPQGYHIVEGSYFHSEDVGYGDYVVFYTRMDISSGKLVFKCYVYGSSLQYRQDRVCWKRTGTTIGNDVVLWSISGTVSDVVSKPYQ